MGLENSEGEERSGGVLECKVVEVCNLRCLKDGGGGGIFVKLPNVASDEMYSRTGQLCGRATVLMWTRRSGPCMFHLMALNMK